MLTINQWLNKLKAARVDFQVCSMLISQVGDTSSRSNILQVIGTYSFLSRLTNINSDLVECNDTQCRLNKQHNSLLMQEDFLPPEAVASQHEDPEDSEPVDDKHVDAFVQLAKSHHKYLSQYCGSHIWYYSQCSEHQHARTIAQLADELRMPHLPHLVCAFLHIKTHSDNDQPCSTCLYFIRNISVFNSASATFYAPSDLCGKEGMWQEYIWACPNWRNEGPHQDCVIVVTDLDRAGFQGMDVAHIICFFAFSFQGHQYPCAVIHWFDHVDNAPIAILGCG